MVCVCVCFFFFMSRSAGCVIAISERVPFFFSARSRFEKTLSLVLDRSTRLCKAMVAV